MAVLQLDIFGITAPCAIDIYEGLSFDLLFMFPDVRWIKTITSVYILLYYRNP